MTTATNTLPKFSTLSQVAREIGRDKRGVRRLIERNGGFDACSTSGELLLRRDRLGALLFAAGTMKARPGLTAKIVC